MRHFAVAIILIITNGLMAQSQPAINDYFGELKQQLNYTTELKLETKKRFYTDFSIRTELLSDAPDRVTIPSAYSYDHLAIFCKLEVQVEKATNIPIKFRLGEVNQIERLEGKPYTPFLMGN